MIEAPSSALQERYQLLRRLGQGGYGVVYEALDRGSGQRVALKELTAVNAMSLAHFKHEFRAMQEVHHPNLVRLEALFEDQGKWMIAMELVEGDDLLKSVYLDEPDHCFDERRLRDVFLQLAEGLDALHAAGFVHRDLKPANVRVTREERVVLLDFGLATGIDPIAQATRSAGLGTLVYMAPEQAERFKVGPAADWYAFGVCLYQALTGVLPIDGPNPLAVLAAKQRSLPGRPSTLAAGVPEDLDELCEALLQIQPAERPDGRAVRRALAGGLHSPRRGSQRPPSLRPQGPGAGFEGREQELRMLSEAFERSLGGQPQVVLVEGDSGIGKTSLIERYAAQVRGPLVLRSRCYESESLGYKAFDGAIYELTTHLNRLSREQRDALMPEHPALLRRLFPAFEVVDVIARAPLHGTAAESSPLRFDAFSAFTSLLAKLSQGQPLIFIMDDLQWADAESFALLQSLLGAQIVRCLVLATVRPRNELEGEAKLGLDALRGLPCVRDLPLLGLPQQSAMALARGLVGTAAPDAWLERMVAESGGHPLFLTVLTRFVGTRDPRMHADLTLDLAISAHIGSLTRKARRLLEVVALAGAPRPAGLCARAAGLAEEDLGRLTTELCRQKLLRRRQAGQIACFHDRIAAVAVGLLEERHARKLHAKLATVFAAHGNIDPAELARHYEAAGELAPACDAYRRGAERALAALAFTRAAQLFGRAFELWRKLGLSEAECNAMRIARAHALARAGRSEEAAAEYLRAAHCAQGEEKTHLRILAAQHLLQSACVQEGIAAAHTLLARLGLPIPTGAAGSYARMAWDRTWLRLHGLDVVSQPGALSPHQRMQLDALWGLSLPIAWLDTLQAAALTTHHLRLARTWREPTHLARALAEEAFMRQWMQPDPAQADQLLARARALCERIDDPALEVRVAYREACVAAARCELHKALAKLEHCQRLASERCPDQPWLITNVRLALGPIWIATGEHAKLAASMTAWLAEAHDRNDRFALSLLQGVGGGHMRHLMADDPDQASAVIEQAAAPWPREPFSFAHLGELMAVSHNQLYRGGDSAHAWFERETARLARSVLLKTRFGSAGVTALRALACIAASHAKPPAEARALQRQALTLSKLLGRLDVRVADLYGGLLHAQLAALAGERAAALSQIAQTRQQCEQCGNRLIETTLLYLQGVLEGEAAGAQLRQTALARFEREGWQAPRKAVRMLGPALDMLETGTDSR